MITVSNGKLTIPEHKRFIGFAGDNLVRTIRFLIKGQQIADKIYRLYLTFDDDTVNYFTLPAEETYEGVVLTWYVQRSHLFKSGVVRAQLKVFSDEGVVYHTNADVFIVGDSAELSDNINNNNTEFLEYEKKLNALADVIKDSALLMPFVGDNGNWYIYDSTKGEYVDSGKPSAYKSDSNDIADASVTSSKIAEGALNRVELFSDEMQKAFLSLPLKSISVTGNISRTYYNQFATPGVYRIDSNMGVHQVLVVLSPDSRAFLMQMLFSYDKVLYRGIFCTEDGVYADDEWEDWTDLCDKGMKKAEDIYCIETIGKNANPQFIMYQTSDPTTDKMIRVPLSVLKDNILSINDESGYFESNTVSGALMEVGSALAGVSELLSQI